VRGSSTVEYSAPHRPPAGPPTPNRGGQRPTAVRPAGPCSSTVRRRDHRDGATSRRHEEDLIGYQEGRIEEARFVLRADQQAPALARLLALARDDFGYDLSDRGLTDVDGFLRLFAIDTVREGDDIVGLTFEDRLLLELEEVLAALAPYVEAGSYVRFHAGSSARWRYEFDGERVTNVDEPSAPWYGS
jgi:hypothetical protein